MTVEIVTIEQLALYVDNPKSPPGDKYQRALDAMLKRYGQVGSIVLTPRCSREEAPALFDKYGATCGGRHIVADGNLRRDTLKRLGWSHVLVLPGPDSADGDPALVEKIGSAPIEVREEYRELVRGGHRVALGIVYPFLNTPVELAQFTLGFDRARRGFDEAGAEKLRTWLINDAKANAELVHTISVASTAALRRYVDKEKQAAREQQVREEQERKAALERAALEAAAAGAEDRAERGEVDGGGGGTGERRAAAAAPTTAAAPATPASTTRPQVRREAPVVFLQPMRLPAPAMAELERLFGVVRSHTLVAGREGRFLSVVERAARRLELGDAAVEVLVDRVNAIEPQGQAEVLSALIDQAKRYRAEDDLLLAAVVAAAREALDAIEAAAKRR